MEVHHEIFSQRVGTLYSLAYPLKIRYKKEYAQGGVPNPSAYTEFSIFPLEGIWTSSNPDNPLDKASFIYTIMIRQPDFITGEMFSAAVAAAEKKGPAPLLPEVSFGPMEEGLCVQMLHKGTFDEEPASFAAMDAFAAGQGLERLNHTHREIYLSDPRKTTPDKRRTILRYQVRPSG